MALSRRELVEGVNRFFGSQLAAFGYSLDKSPEITGGRELWFVKPPDEHQAMFRIIGLQPSGFGPDECYKLAVNLYRRKRLNELEIKEDPGDPPSFWAVRLSPAIWGKGLQRTMDHWWHFTDREELDAELRDVLQKLEQAGIPFLEDPNSDWEAYRHGTFKPTD